MTVSVEVDEETLRELYLVPFEAAVTRAGVRCVMSAYNRLNGTFCSEHEWLLSDVLRGNWGFDGVVVSDWHGCHSGARVVARRTRRRDAGTAGPSRRRAGRRDRLGSGIARRPRPRRRQRRRASPSGRTPVSRPATSDGDDGPDATRELIRRAAVAAMVLLKNDGGLLPLGLTTQRLGADRAERRRGQGPGRWQRPGDARSASSVRWTRCAAAATT